MPYTFAGRCAAAGDGKRPEKIALTPESFRSGGIERAPRSSTGPTTTTLPLPPTAARPCSEQPPSSASTQPARASRGRRRGAAEPGRRGRARGRLVGRPPTERYGARRGARRRCVLRAREGPRAPSPASMCSSVVVVQLRAPPPRGGERGAQGSRRCRRRRAEEGGRLCSGLRARDRGRSHESASWPLIILVIMTSTI
jgi:hypothetical protein